MELYFAPMACSLATRIALYEAGAAARFTQADTHSKTLADGSDFFAINPMGQVPALRLDDGSVLTENTAVLQYVAEQFPNARLAPRPGVERSRMQQWLGFIGTELHKAVFVPLLDDKASDAYMATILNWAGATQVDLKQWPEVYDYHQRMLKRPSIAKATGEEFALYKEEVARRKRA
jgi:glutathione S-transferase